MDLLIVDSNLSGAKECQVKTNCASNIRVSRCSQNLSDAYHFAEHHEPDAVLVSAQFAYKPEFEVMNLMLRALSIQCVILVPHSNFDHATIVLAKRLGATILDTSLNAEAFCASLSTIEKTHSIANLTSLDHSSGFSGPHNTHDFKAGHRILLGSSTGGVEALLAILSQFPADCPPTLIVQHTGASFSAGLAKLLNSRVAPTVLEAQDGNAMQSGKVLLAPGSSRHLVLAGKNGHHCRLREGIAVSGHRPSVDELFQSAVPFASATVAAILTGMGRDGARGLTELRRAGATTFGQDERTSVVYGMPRVAFELGGVEHQMPIEKMGSAILQACSEKKDTLV